RRQAPESSVVPYTPLFRSFGATVGRGLAVVAADRLDVRRKRAQEQGVAQCVVGWREHTDAVAARLVAVAHRAQAQHAGIDRGGRSEEHTSALQSRENLVCR